VRACSHGGAHPRRDRTVMAASFSASTLSAASCDGARCSTPCSHSAGCLLPCSHSAGCLLPRLMPCCLPHGLLAQRWLPRGHHARTVVVCRNIGPTGKVWDGGRARLGHVTHTQVGSLVWDTYTACSRHCHGICKARVPCPLNNEPVTKEGGVTIQNVASITNSTSFIIKVKA